MNSLSNASRRVAAGIASAAAAVLPPARAVAALP